MNQAPYLTPYLGLRARLSQIWINRWTVLLLLVLVRVLIATADLKSNMDSARTEALSACTSVETAGSVMASMPHYMSQGVNELTAAGIENAVDGLVSMLKLTITGVEEIVLFYINMMTSTYVCLLTAAVGGALHVSIEVVEDVTSALNKTLDSIGDDISSVADDFQDEVNKLIDGINSIPEIFGGKGMDKLNLTKQIDELKNLQLPSGLDEGLDKLNNSIPTFDEVHNLTNAAIRFPFEEVKTLISDHIGNFSVNRSLFPVPAKEQLTFCSDDNGINDFFDGLLHIEILAKKIFIAVIVILAVAVCVPMGWREIRRWRTMQQRAQLVGKSAYDPMDVVYIASRPYTSGFGISVANRFSSTRRQVAVRWAVAYATTTPALFVLSLGLAGLFACLCQYILLKSIEKEVPALTQQVGDFADKVVFALNNASEQWANGTNNVILSTNNDLNQDVFGWVNTSTTAVNNTLTVFVDEMTKVLNETFGGTVLYNPIMDVVNCLILIKIKGIQSGLTWVQDHAHINFPLLPNDTFSLGAAASMSNDSSFLASPDSSTEDAVTGAVTKLVNKLVEGIKTEALISTCIVMCWVAIVLIGIIRACFIFCGQGKTRAEGGQAYVIDPVTDNFRGHDAAPYTIIPRPFPHFGSSSEYQASEVGSHESEKVGEVGASHPSRAGLAHDTGG
ncbi:putative pheromone-regulated multispanning membrane protein Prm1 [Saccharata proteae CBS 121410]|uniref:Plasma membrane fusion protein PRM1 n=1 Tax=Saccharata proteae CBS 121410 TaxID=1314787 RepID=A0A9P4HYV0_9PEZI|nr:putative pheromone-regulated multispanning membrane protein Prm1 [Saccharata proteae CBS 121410]